MNIALTGENEPTLTGGDRPPQGRVRYELGFWVVLFALVIVGGTKKVFRTDSAMLSEPFKLPLR